MKTKTVTKQIRQARQNKQAYQGKKVSKKEAIMQYVATGLFFAAIALVWINMF